MELVKESFLRGAAGGSRRSRPRLIEGHSYWPGQASPSLRVQGVMQEHGQGGWGWRRSRGLSPWLS